MSPTTHPSYRIRRTNLAWRIPAISKAAQPAQSIAHNAIGSAYAESPLATSPAKALFAALAASTTLFVTVGALALPAAAFV